MHGVVDMLKKAKKTEDVKRILQLANEFEQASGDTKRRWVLVASKRLDELYYSGADLR